VDLWTDAKLATGQQFQVTPRAGLTAGIHIGTARETITMTAVRQAGSGQPRGVSGTDEVPATPAAPDRQPDVSPAAAARLLRACSARGWTIASHDDLRYWSAERVSHGGRRIRYICAHSAVVLAVRIAAADLAQQ
jgi:hypothetical protein